MILLNSTHSPAPVGTTGALRPLRSDKENGGQCTITEANFPNLILLYFLYMTLITSRYQRNWSSNGSNWIWQMSPWTQRWFKVPGSWPEVEVFILLYYLLNVVCSRPFWLLSLATYVYSGEWWEIDGLGWIKKVSNCFICASLKRSWAYFLCIFK